MNGAWISHINEAYDIGEEYRAVFGKAMPSGKFFCPFHANVNTPAAKRYYNGIKCYSCNKFYTVYDFLRAFNPSRLEALKQTVTVDAAYVPTGSAPTKERITFVSYEPTERIEDILTKIVTANGLEV